MQEWEDSGQNTSVPMLVTRPTGHVRAGLILIHEAFGVTPHIEELCTRFATEGYLVVAPDLFHTLGQRVFPYDQVGRAKEALAKLDPATLVGDVSSTVGWALMDRAIRGRPVGVVGFCFGGKVSFMAASQLPVLESAVCFYGSGIGSTEPDAPIKRVGSIEAPILALYGEQDPLIPPEEVARVREGLALSGVPSVVRTYSEAGHGFFCDARPANFNEDAARDAWGLTCSFLSRTLCA
jgi:carboxymethylenebutenolidase